MSSPSFHPICFAPARKGAGRFAAARLDAARLRRLREEALDGLLGLGAALLLKLVDPVGDRRDLVACGLLCRPLGVGWGFGAVFQAVAIVALDDFDRGFCLYDDLLFRL